MMQPVAIFVTLALTFGHVTCVRDYWMHEPYGNESYHERQMYESNFTLECDDGLVPELYNMTFWIRPDMTIMKRGDYETFWTLDGYASWEVFDNGTMFITILQESQFGLYHCVLTDENGNYFAVKKAVNYKGAYFGDLWPKYRLPTIIGCSSAGGFLALAIALMFVCVKKCPGPPEEEMDEDKYDGSRMEEEIESTVQGAEGGIDNTVFVVEDSRATTSSSGSSSDKARRRYNDDMPPIYMSDEVSTAL